MGARDYLILRKVGKVLIALLIGYPLSFFLVFNVFTWPTKSGTPGRMELPGDDNRLRW